MAAGGSGDKPEQVDLNKLSIEQLSQLKTEFEQEMTNIQESLQTLYTCKGKYAGSKEALESFQPDWNDRSILVPLTSSMYVPGRIKDMDNFMIDIGTGYYVEKNLVESKDYFKRRVEFVQEQIEKIELIQMQKSRFLNALISVLEYKQAAYLKMLNARESQAASS